MAHVCSLISHWLPVVTICPVNKLPDFLYVTVVVEGQFVELFEARRRIRKAVPFLSRTFMEDVASTVLGAFPEATEVHVTLLFNRHVCIATRDQ